MRRYQLVDESAAVLGLGAKNVKCRELTYFVFSPRAMGVSGKRCTYESSNFWANVGAGDGAEFDADVLREANAAAIGDTIALPAITLSRRGRVRPLVII